MNSHMLNSFRCSGRGMAELPRTVVLLLDLVPESMVPLPHVLSAVGSLMAPVGGLEPAGSELLFVWQLRQNTILPRGWLAVLRVRTSRHIGPGKLQVWRASRQRAILLDLLPLVDELVGLVEPDG